MVLSPHPYIAVHYYDVTKYGRPDVIEQSLDGGVDLEGGRYDFIFVAQASGTLLAATPAARMLVAALLPGGILVFARMANSVTAITHMTAAALTQAEALGVGQLLDFPALHELNPELKEMARELYTIGFLRARAEDSTPWPAHVPPVMRLFGARGGEDAPLDVVMSAGGRRSDKLFTYFVMPAPPLEAAAARRSLLYAGSGGVLRLCDKNHPTLRDAFPEFRAGRRAWQGFQPLRDLPRSFLYDLLGEAPTHDGAPTQTLGGMCFVGALRSHTHAPRVPPQACGWSYLGTKRSSWNSRESEASSTHSEKKSCL
jgi:hypothetical protein